jgi:hypothetical protein
MSARNFFMSNLSHLSAELDQALSIAHVFYLGDDPEQWSDNDIDSTAESIADTSGVDWNDIKLFLVSEREATRLRRH